MASLLGAGALAGLGCSTDPAPQSGGKDAGADVSSSGSGTGGSTGSGGTTTGSGGATGSGGVTGSGGSGSGGASGSGGSGSGGASGSGGSGSGGSSGSGGGNPGPDASADTVSGAHPTCTLVIGVSVTYDWFTGGFETGVDNARWEGLAPAAAGRSFIEDWADPTSGLWTMGKLSPCTQNAANPDRVIFVGVNWTFNSAAQWLAQYDAVIATLKAKYSNLKSIYLDTLIRGPGNKNCGGNDATSEVVVRPYIDDAIGMAVAKYPGLVKAAPKLYVPNCGVFTGAGPHFTAAGIRVVAKVYSDNYATDQ
jgi:hypothetical protein